jgi:hypothetical protein
VAEQPGPVPGGLPTRVAEVTHALMEAWTTAGGSAPLTVAEICVYDSNALNVEYTRRALRQARTCGLTDGAGGLWFATSRAWEMRRELDDWFYGNG